MGARLGAAEHDNPVRHALTAADVARYKVEPYVVAAAHRARGMELESLLGLKRVGDQLVFTPCLPAEWPGMTIHYRYRETLFHIAVVQRAAGEDGRQGVMGVRVDGVEQADKEIPLRDDRQEHQVDVEVCR